MESTNGAEQLSSNMSHGTVSDGRGVYNREEKRERRSRTRAYGRLALGAFNVLFAAAPAVLPQLDGVSMQVLRSVIFDLDLVFFTPSFLSCKEPNLFVCFEKL